MIDRTRTLGRPALEVSTLGVGCVGLPVRELDPLVERVRAARYCQAGMAAVGRWP